MKYVFQKAIEVKVAFFEMLGNSSFILDEINLRLARKKYMARRITGVKELTISIYNSKNECMDERFFRKYDNFIDFKPTEVRNYIKIIEY